MGVDLLPQLLQHCQAGGVFGLRDEYPNLLGEQGWLVRRSAVEVIGTDGPKRQRIVNPARRGVFGGGGGTPGVGYRGPKRFLQL